MSVSPAVRGRRCAAAAEQSKDFATAIAALREVRHGIELLAKLTGELDPLRNTLAEDTRIQVEIIRVEAPPLPKPASQVIEAVRVPDKPN